MSFPSAPQFLEEGMNPDDALLAAIKKDTPDGYAYLCGLTDAHRKQAKDPVTHVRNHIPCTGCAGKVLRAEWMPSGGLKVDVDPNSKLGGQVMRLLGTDVARNVLEEHFGMSFALANCCGGITGNGKIETTFSVQDQIKWQHSIDC